MNTALCLLAVVAAAFAQHPDATLGFGGIKSAEWRTGGADTAAKMATFTTQTAGPTGIPAGRSAWMSDDAELTKTATGFTAGMDGKMMATGRSLWNTNAKMAASGPATWNTDEKMTISSVPSWNTDAKMMAVGRSLWNTNAKMAASGPATWNTDEKMTISSAPSWNTDAKMMAVGRSLWNTDAKMAASGRSAWDSNSAHLIKDAQPNSEILMQEIEMPAPGFYKYSFKTANGIEAQEQAALKAEDSEAVQGVYSWVAPSGERFAVEYVADETGYHARGAHIPEMPAAIARSLEWNAAHPEEEMESAKWEQHESSGRSAWESPAWQQQSSMIKSSSVGRSAAAWGATGATGRSAWVSESSAAIPAWESAAKIESADHAALVGGAASLRSAAWDAQARQAAIPAWQSGANLGSGKITKITETRTLHGSPAGFAASSFAPGFASGRSTWNSGISGSSDLSGLGATKITKITETKTVGSPSTFASSLSGRPALLTSLA